MDEREQRFSEEEALALVLAASEKQGQGSSSKLSLEDLKRIAGELGVEAGHVEAVVQQGVTVDRGIVKREGRVLGRSFVVEYEAVVSGELSSGQFDFVLDELTEPRTKPIISEKLVRGYFDAGLAMGKVTVSCKSGQTRIRVRSNAWGLLIGWCAGGMVLTFLAAMVFQFLTNFAFVIGILILTLSLLAYPMYQLLQVAHAKVEHRFRRLVTSVRDELE